MKNKENYERYMQTFLQENAKLNLISKNEEKFLWEKHILDSLAIAQIFADKRLDGLRLLDIGTGGGFPAVPIALRYPQLEVYALDSIRKKINAIENIKTELGIANLHTICERAERLTDKFDIITSRAVAPLKVIAGYALPLLKKDGYFVAYKSKKAQVEIEEAKGILRKYHAKILAIKEYELPLEEIHTRNLIVVSGNGEE